MVARGRARRTIGRVGFHAGKGVAIVETFVGVAQGNAEAERKVGVLTALVGDFRHQIVAVEGGVIMPVQPEYPSRPQRGRGACAVEQTPPAAQLLRADGRQTGGVRVVIHEFVAQVDVAEAVGVHVGHAHHGRIGIAPVIAAQRNPARQGRLPQRKGDDHLFPEIAFQAGAGRVEQPGDGVCVMRLRRVRKDDRIRAVFFLKVEVDPLFFHAPAHIVIETFLILHGEFRSRVALIRQAKLVRKVEEGLRRHQFPQDIFQLFVKEDRALPYPGQLPESGPQMYGIPGVAVEETPLFHGRGVARKDRGGGVAVAQNLEAAGRGEQFGRIHGRIGADEINMKIKQAMQPLHAAEACHMKRRLRLSRRKEAKAFSQGCCHRFFLWCCMRSVSLTTEKNLRDFGEERKRQTGCGRAHARRGGRSRSYCDASDWVSCDFSSLAMRSSSFFTKF